MSTKHLTVQVVGPTFFDLVFSGLAGQFGGGTEVFSQDLGSSPGGAATVAVALARLGVEARLTSVFADDLYGRYLTDTLRAEGVDISSSRVDPAWTTPVTVSMAWANDRSMVTHQEPASWTPVELLAEPPDADGLVLMLQADEELDRGLLTSSRATVFADVGFVTGRTVAPTLAARLEGIDVFLPNSSESIDFTGAADVRSAARALAREVPLVVVKSGADGAIAAGGDRLITEPGVATVDIDPTGAGDIFDAAFVYSTLSGMPIDQCLKFSNLCAAQSLSFTGGALSAPCWRDIRAWWAISQFEDETSLRYEFLRKITEDAPPSPACRRATPTIG